MEKANADSDAIADRAERQLGISNSERFARQASMADPLDDNTTTAAIDDAIADHPADHTFTDAAAFALVRKDSQRAI
ncbi:hypothetical protein VSS74_03960 [Conexibacter stalactiti]|uniref:Uncharacterized protein n=1 Tax=Conexibacter stalactiti TaxID=1940611 RepID=A0ABU4HJH7_9ACTN|nr:hypothetical protein [Conexibacter stalactiti]MDW5593478.1 hypothetical protein [Conexibacter stalactiti]MEC5034119.1 hypothetical protein [Conexibacter stalactiti]